MQVREIEYNHSMLDAFGPNELYRKCHRELLNDFEVTYKELLDKKLPEGLTEAQIAGVKEQKTNYLVAYVSGHLNAFNPQSTFFNKFNELTDIPKKKDDPLAGLILPDHLRTK